MQARNIEVRGMVGGKEVETIANALVMISPVNWEAGCGSDNYRSRILTADIC